MEESLVTASEQADIAAWKDMYDAAPPAFRARHNLNAIARNGALVLASTDLPLGHFNSMIGLGVGAPATEAQIDDAVEDFRRVHAARYMIHLVPGAQPPELESWLTARGLRQTGAWERVGRGRDPLFAGVTGYSSVESISDRNAIDWARFIDRVYGLRNEPWLLALAGRDGWRHYALRHEGEIVAARSMYINAALHAWLGIDAPIPGLMTNRFDRDMSLCAAMISDGLSAGVEWFFTDIEAPRANHDGPAYEGFARLGFKPIYLRRHFASPPVS